MEYGELEPEHISHRSAFEHLDETLDNSIHGLIAAFNKDPTPRKLNLAVGVYRTEEGKPLVLNVVRRAEERLITERQYKEYLPITGLQNFNKAAAKLLLGSDSPAILERRVVTAQCVSGSGSLRVGGEFLAKHYNVKVVYLPQPTWENHYEIFLNSGLTIKTYRYYDTRTHGLDYQGMLQDIRGAQSGSVILLHPCAHNPTGVDPTCEQWQGIRHLIRAKGHLPLFDCAYQGFASGSLDEDAYAIRSFAGDDGECLIAQSFSKNLGLYGERVGALSIVCRGEAAAICVESQLKLVIRPMYSSPPIHGASIASIILNDSDLFSEWTFELKAMADRVTDMRHQLYDALQARGTPGNWTHILKQVGMFSFSGLNKQQVEFMTRKYHIYMTLDGRISMGALRSSTIPHLADAIHAAVTQIHSRLEVLN